MTKPDSIFEVEEELVVLLLAKAALVGMKHVIEGVLSRMAVRFEELVRLVKVVCPFATAVAERDSGRVKKL
jgi:hypothetical protein